MGSNSAKTPWMQRLQAAGVRCVPGAGFLFAVIPLVVLGYVGWYFYGAEHLDRALYSLQKENLHVTAQPAWVGGDVVEEVFTQARLDRLSLLDPAATAAVAQAFEAHHWVKAAARVTKESGGVVHVDLIYRRPLAMVYFAPSPNDSGESSAAGFFPVDEDAIVLPTQDFDGSKVFEYFLIFADGARPSGDVGMPFGDPRIADAVELCRLLEPERRSLGLREVWVEAAPRRVSGARPWMLIVVTDQEQRIVWGQPPSVETSQEPTPAQKRETMIVRLRQGLPPKATLDLRTAAPTAQVSQQAEAPAGVH